MNGPVSITRPAVALVDVSGSSGRPPRSCAALKVDGTVALSSRSRVFGVDARLHVERVLLAGRRHAEPGAGAAAYRAGIAQAVAGGELAVRRCAEHVEAFDAQGAADGPAVGGFPQLDVAVKGNVRTSPSAGRVVGKPGEAVGTGDEALRRERTDLPRRTLAGADREALVPPFCLGRYGASSWQTPKGIATSGRETRTHRSSATC